MTHICVGELCQHSFRIHQHTKFQAILLACVLTKCPEGRTESRLIGHPVYDGSVEWAEGRTDGQPENIMPPASRGRGIKTQVLIDENAVQNVICKI